MLWLHNGPAFLKAWFGANFLGAAVAALNVQYRGALLQHLINLSTAKVAVIDCSLVPHIAELDLNFLRTALVAGDFEISGAPTGVSLKPAQAVLDSMIDLVAMTIPIEPWDTQFIIFTSGTTGPSKGVIVPYVQMQTLSMVHYEGRLGIEDRYLVNMPLFHVTGLLPAFGAMLTGGSIVVVDRFRTETFWQVIRTHRITGCTMVGAMAAFVETQPPQCDDTENPLRWISMFPLVRDPASFAERFAVRITTSYGMSEISMPIISPINPVDAASCGQLRAGYEARIVDAFDREVAQGDVGELIVRSNRPWSITPGYWRNSEETAAAWRNGWFHTGDNFRLDEHDNYYFIDRKKDAIRRRGENISSFELEQEVLAHPAIAEAAAIAVTSPLGDDEVMIVVVAAVGAARDPTALIEFLAPRIARFTLPRFIRYVSSLPKTPTMRVQKHLLRADGITPDTWDRAPSRKS